MPSFEYIHGGSDEREVARLEKQARFVSPWILKDFQALPGERVLDLATGVGAMAGQLLARHPGIELIGVDLRESQLHHARTNHPAAHYLQADATALPFPDTFFDRVHCSWLLEHLPQPLAALREVLRVLKPGGTAQFSEVDNSTFKVEPELLEPREAMEMLDRVQRQNGGDPNVGAKLEALMREAGFSRVEAETLALRGGAEDPAFFQAMIDDVAEIFESLDEALTPNQVAMATRGAEVLRSLPQLPGSSVSYSIVVARAVR